VVNVIIFQSSKHKVTRQLESYNIWYVISRDQVYLQLLFLLLFSFFSYMTLPFGPGQSNTEKKKDKES
jgi:hypothetical protein